MLFHLNIFSLNLNSKLILPFRYINPLGQHFPLLPVPQPNLFLTTKPSTHQSTTATEQNTASRQVLSDVMLNAMQLVENKTKGTAGLTAGSCVLPLK